MENQKDIDNNEKGIAAVYIVIAVIVVIMLGIIIACQFAKREPEETVTKPEKSSIEEKEEYVMNLEDGSKLNVSKEMQNPKKLNNLEISNIQLKEIGGITTLLADIVNKGKDDTEEKMIKVEILDKDDNVITTIEGPIDSIKAGGKVQLNFSVTGDVSNAHDFRISE